MHLWKDIKNAKPKKLGLLVRLRRFVVGNYKQGGLIGLYWWIRNHTLERHHIINLSGVDGYKYGWIDSDRKIELAAWKVLVDFVDKEDPFVGQNLEPEIPGDDAYNWAVSYNNSQREIHELYVWWTLDRPMLLAELEAAKPFEERLAMRKALDAKDDEMLLRLIAIRGHLWT